MSRGSIAPRLLTEDQAAGYLSLPVTEVRKLSFGRIVLGAKTRFDRIALDAHLDRLSGLASQSVSPQNDAVAELANFVASHPHVARSA